MGLTNMEPKGIVNRAQAVTFLHRFFEKTESNVYYRTGLELDLYEDGYLVEGRFAEEAMTWALEHGIIEGYTDGLLHPFEDMTRAQCAKMIYNYVIEADATHPSNPIDY